MALEGTAVSKRLNNVTINAITPRVIETGRLEKVKFQDEEEITLEKSWIEFMLLLVGAIYDSRKEEFTRILADNKVLSDGFKVNNTNVKYDKKYMIFGCRGEVYIAVRKEAEVISDAIVKLLRAVGKGKVGDTRLWIAPITSKKGTEELETELNDLVTILYSGKDDIVVTGISIGDLTDTVNEEKPEQAIALLISYSIHVNGKEKTKQYAKEASYALMGVCDEIDYSDGKKHMKIAEITFYYERYAPAILMYLYKFAKNLGLDSKIKIRYKLGGN